MMEVASIVHKIIAVLYNDNYTREKSSRHLQTMEIVFTMPRFKVNVFK